MAVRTKAEVTQRRTAKLLVFLAASGLVPTVSFLAARTLLRGSGFPEFTAFTRQQGVRADGSIEFSVLYVHAQRSDGSTAEVLTGRGENAASSVMSQVVDLRTNTRRTISENPSLSWTARLTRGEAEAIKVRKAKCQSASDKTREILGYATVNVIGSGAGFVVQEWQALELSCYPLNSRVVHLAQGRPLRRVNTVVLHVKKGPPAPSFFR
jgi:hypothetical protein